MTLLVPFDAAAPPQDTWGPMLVVALVVVAVVAMILGFGRITRRRAPDGEVAGDRPGGTETESGSTGPATTSDDELPTDPV